MNRLRLATVTATVIWGLTVGIGYLALQLHGASPGQGGRVVELWPDQSRIPLTSGWPTLVIAAHPLCPCTRATVAELTRVLTRCAGKVEVYILILLPERAGHDWGPTDGLRRLGTMPGVHLIDDPGGEEAARFAPGLPVLLHCTLQTGGSIFAAGSRVPGATKGITPASRPCLA